MMKSAAERLSENLRKKRRSRPGRLNIVWDCQIVRLRTELHLTLRDVERATDISNPALSFIERGTDPQLTNARKLAEFFGKSIEEIWPRRIGE